MNPVIVTGAAVLTLAALLPLVHVPLGTWIHRVFTDEKDWRAERAVYRLVGVDPRTEQRRSGYAVSVLAFAVVSVLALRAAPTTSPPDRSPAAARSPTVTRDPQRGDGCGATLYGRA